MAYKPKQLACFSSQSDILSLGSEKKKAANPGGFFCFGTEEDGPALHITHIRDRIAAPQNSGRFRSALTLVINAFTSANKLMTHANPVFAPANKLMEHTTQLPSCQLSSSFARANKALASPINAKTLVSQLPCFVLPARRHGGTTQAKPLKTRN